MKGVIIWAQSDCRSMMGLYRALIKEFGVPVVIAVRDFKAESQRQKVGFKHEEFNDLEITVIGDDYQKGIRLLDAHPGFHHLFGSYQNAPIYRRLILDAKRRGCRVGVLSEAPCVMTNDIKGWVKGRIYLPIFLKHIIKPIVGAADFIVNLSGDSSLALQNIGWGVEQIVPFGYYPPPIVGSKVFRRTTNKNFQIAITGIMTWHRAPDVIVNALKLLKQWDVPYKAIFTQDGPLKKQLQKLSEDASLPVEFVGFLPLAKLIELYQTCSVYVAAGRAEPWGMRLNDALQCGAPLCVSRGMGGVKLVDDYGCGMSFISDDYLDLACKLRRLIEDGDEFRRVALNAENAASQILPELKAKMLREEIARRFNDWK